MSDTSKVMRWGVMVAAAIIVLRIALEQAGAPESVNGVLGVAWLYLIFPVLYALAIRARNEARPYLQLLKGVFLFGVYTRLMVMITYMLAYVFRWQAPRFVYPGGTVGPNVDPWSGLVRIPVRNVLIWVAIATIVGMLIGSITLALRKKGSAATD